MQRLKLENGKYAYRFEPDELIRMNGRAVVIDDEEKTVTVGYVSRAWDLDENYVRFHEVDCLNSKAAGLLPEALSEDPQDG